ncbi:MAG TPA: hypothetical protein VHQ90_18470 [Thermoanaerobaculia bacterium]|nr:hypothetical protein [Thermoanaerobaculia bacterium]
MSSSAAVATAGGLLSEAERRTLQSVCETLLPALRPEAGDAPDLFALAASSLDVAAEVERVAGGLRGEQQADLSRLLRLLGQPACMLLLVGRVRAFPGLPPSRRERALLAMATSRWEPLRTGFQVLKRLATCLFYSVCPAGGDNPAWAAIGYARSANPPPEAARLQCETGSDPDIEVRIAFIDPAGKRSKETMLEFPSGERRKQFELLSKSISMP